MPRKILIVGDKTAFSDAAGRLAAMGCRVRSAPTGEKAVAALVSFKPDLLVAELDLPGISGLSLLDVARQDPAVRRGMLSVVVTSDGSAGAVLKAFEKGADDFLVKPFDARELCARVEVLFRRTDRSLDSDRIECGGIVLEPATRRVEAGGRSVRLTRSEFLLLYLFAQKAGRVLTRDYILHCLWGTPAAGPTRTVDMHVANLRRKLGPEAGSRIETVPAMGYLFRRHPEPGTGHSRPRRANG